MQSPWYDTPEELDEKIREYFEKGVKMKTVVLGPPNKRYEIQVAVPTITGLCLYLGFESRQSFYDYEKREAFSYTIKKARLLIETEYEEMLQAGNTAGAIFALKNFGWTDKTEVEQKTTIKDERIDDSKFTDEELRILAELQRKGRTSTQEGS